MNKNIVKAIKTKKSAYRNELAFSDKNLLLANSEILVFRAQNEAKLIFFAIFSQLQTETLLQQLNPDETFIIKEMKFLPDTEQFQFKQAEGKSQLSSHKNILAIVDNQNRVYLIDIEVDYENGKMACIIFADMPSREQEMCQQILWLGEHLMILKEGLLIIDRKLKLKNRSIMQKQQYLVGSKEIACKRIVAGKTQQNKKFFYGICGNANSVFLNEKDNQTLFFAISLTQNSDLLDIYFSAYNDIIVATKSGALYALDSEKLDKLQTYNTKLEDDEFVVETHMDNALTSIFLLTNKNQIYHVFIQKAKLKDGSIKVFKSKGNLRFHNKNVIFTFCVLAIPEPIEQCLFKQNENNQQIQTSFQTFKPSLSNVKYLLFSLLASEEVMKIFSVDLSTHEQIYQDSDIELEFPITYLESVDFLNQSNIAPSNIVSSNQQLPNNDEINNLFQALQSNSNQRPQQQIIQQQTHENVQNTRIANPQEVAEQKPSSRPVNPSILPQQQDPILGLISNQFEQYQQIQAQIQPSQQSNLINQQSSYTSHEQKEVRKKNQIRTLTNQNEKNVEPEESKYSDQVSHHSHHQHSEHKNYLEEIKDIKINKIFDENVDRMTTQLDEYFEKKFNKLDAIVGAKIEKIRKEDDIVNMVEKSTQSQRDKLEQFLHDEMEVQYKSYVEQNMKTYMIDMFQQVTKIFERGQKFYTDKIQQEKEKSKIQNENSDEILSIVKKITSPFSESTITSKKILTEIVQLSTERKNKMDNLEKQLTHLISKQDQIVTRISTMEKTLQEEMAPQKIQKIIEQSVANQIQKLQYQGATTSKNDNVVIQQIKKPPHQQQSDINSANESGGDNRRKTIKKKDQKPSQNQ
ncbi:hypothetical protein ABPG72_018384 [Tetrahymena utriculariae]